MLRGRTFTKKMTRKKKINLTSLTVLKKTTMKTTTLHMTPSRIARTIISAKV
jgi:hypothetical protein